MSAALLHIPDALPQALQAAACPPRSALDQLLSYLYGMVLRNEDQQISLDSLSEALSSLPLILLHFQHRFTRHGAAYAPSSQSESR
jgi:hypothetical protein